MNFRALLLLALTLPSGAFAATKFEPVPAFRFSTHLDETAGKALFQAFVDLGLMRLHNQDGQETLAVDSLYAQAWERGRDATCDDGVGYILTLTTPPDRRRIELDEGNVCKVAKAGTLFLALEKIAGSKTEESYKRITDFCMTDLSITESFGQKAGYDVSGTVLSCSLFWPPNT